MPNFSISVIIPAIDEAEQLPVLLRYLRQMPAGALLQEIIVVDGGSKDDTVIVAEALGAIVVKSKKGRAVQMNNGAAIANGTVLYFLHADTFPPENAWTILQSAIKTNIDAGCFRLKFDTTSWFLKANAWFTRFDINAIRFGDQSLFIKKETFTEVRGFDENHIVLEDQEIIVRIKKKFHFTVLPFAVTTSDRKYRENGNVRLQLIFFGICILYRLGYSQQQLVGTYRRWIRKGKI